MEFLDSHEGSNEVIKYVDEPLANLLEYMLKLEEDTTIVFITDHGNHMRSFYYYLDTQQYYIEEMLPVYFLILPENKNNNSDSDHFQKYRENIENNQQSLVDGINFYSTMRVISGNYQPYLFNFSVFSQLPKNLNCTHALSRFNEEFLCACKTRT